MSKEKTIPFQQVPQNNENLPIPDSKQLILSPDPKSQKENIPKKSFLSPEKNFISPEKPMNTTAAIFHELNLDNFPKKIIPYSSGRQKLKIPSFLNMQYQYLEYLLGYPVDEKDLETGLTTEFNNKYMDEEQYNPGDYVIVFPNPDHHSYYKKYSNYTYNLSEAFKIYTKIFYVNSNNRKETFHFNALERSFALAFNKLKSSDKIGKKNEYIKKMNKKLGNKKTESGKERFEDLDLTFFDEKINANGGFLSHTKDKWERTNNHTMDFPTLIRNVIQLRLAKEAGFKLRSFLSDDGKEIYLVMHADEENLEIVAQNLKIDKEIELAFSNLLSLEPVDASFRPLRINSFLLKTRENKEEENLRLEIVSYLTLINFKKLAKECNDNLFIDAETAPEILDEQVVPIKTWKVYLFYLKELSQQVVELRDYFLVKKHNLNEDDLNEIMPNKTKNFPLLLPDASLKTRLIRKRKEEKAKTPNTKLLKRRNREKLCHQYKKVFTEILKQTKKKFGKNSLKNIWEKLGTRPLEAFTDYYNPPKNINEKVRYKIKTFWKKYESSEKGTNSIFLNMERLKLVYIILNKMFNLTEMKEFGLVNDNFFLNDSYALFGEKKTKLFKKYDNSSAHISHLSIHLKNKEERKSNELKLIEKENEYNIFYKKIKPVDQLWSMFHDIDMVVKIPETAIREYYGEKIALFYKFFNYYIIQLLIMTPIGTVTFILLQIFEDLLALQIIIFIFCVVNAIWASIFTELWHSRESVFAIKYGQTELEEEEQVRPEFNGNFKRSMINDEINEEYDTGRSRNFLLFLAFVIGLGFFIGNIALSIGLVKVSSKLKADIEYINFLEPPILISAIINQAYIAITNLIFMGFCRVFTDWENHKTVTQYENSYITKILIFRIVNNLIPYVILCFIAEFFIDCEDYDCYVYIQTYFRSILYCLFAMNLLGFFLPLLGYLIKKTGSLFVRNKDSGDFSKIDDFIESENIKYNFRISEELDGTLEYYVDLSVNFALVSLFGILFPMIFPMSFLFWIVSMKLAKKKLLNFTTRPTPSGAADIGAFKQVYHLIGYLSILTNAGIITQTSGILEEKHLIAFIVIVIGIFIIKFVMKKILGQTPERVDLIKKRNEMITDKTAKFFFTRTTSFVMVTKKPIYKIFGSILERRPKKEEN